MQDNIVIVAAGRTALGTFGGSLSSLPASELGATVIKGLLERSGLKPEQINEVILGQVLTAGVGQNPARQAVLSAGLPVEKRMELKRCNFSNSSSCCCSNVFICEREWSLNCC